MKKKIGGRSYGGEVFLKIAVVLVFKKETSNVREAWEEKRNVGEENYCYVKFSCVVSTLSCSSFISVSLSFPYPMF